MSDNKGLKITLTIVAVILLVAAIATYILRDTKGPHINVEQSNITYVEGDEKTILLDGVSAYDDKDGDVTDSVMVKDIVVMNNGEQARVIYAARDKNNNISEAYRIVTYVESDKAYASPEDAISEETINEVEEYLQGDVDETEQDYIEQEDNQEDSSEESENQEDEEEPENDEEKVEEAQNQETSNQNEAPKQDDKTPRITLKQKSVSINAGQVFNPADYIKSKENASAIGIDGGIDVTVPGTYPSIL